MRHGQTPGQTLERKGKTMAKGERGRVRYFVGKFDQSFGELTAFGGMIPRVWCPPTDVYETPDAWVVRMEVAGVRKEDLRVTIEAGALFVRGRRAEVASGPKERYHRMEIRYGEFSQRIPLPPDIEAEATDARLRDGILEVRVPRTASSRRKVSRQLPDAM